MHNHVTLTIDTQPLPVTSQQVRYRVLIIVMLVYAVNIADRFVASTLIEPIKAEFHLSDSAIGFLTGSALALFYSVAGLPLGALADRAHRRNMIGWTLTIWSAFVAVGGLAQGFWLLLFSRIGVGIGEAGATPASHSLLADYFPRSERVVAMAIFALGVPLGMGLGGVGGGLIAAHFGWRSVFIIFALAAAPLLLLLMKIREPVRGAFEAPARPAAPSLRDSVAFIGRHKALRHIIAGATVATFAGQGLVWWTPAFLARSHGFDVGGAGLSVGLMNGLGGTLALIATALITIWLARGPIRWQGHFLAIVTLLIALSGTAAFAARGTGAALALLWLFVPFNSVHVGPTLALMQNLVPPGMRGMSVAIFLFGANVAGLALAPQLIGLASDLLAPHLANPAQSLGVALSVSALSGLWSAGHFWRATHHLPEHETP